MPRADGRGVWKAGDKMNCRHKARARLFAGVIENIKGNKLFIKYKDGDSAWTTAQFLRRCPPAPCRNHAERAGSQP